MKGIIGTYNNDKTIKQPLVNQFGCMEVYHLFPAPFYEAFTGPIMQMYRPILVPKRTFIQKR